jgi:hypothetical protein
VTPSRSRGPPILDKVTWCDLNIIPCVTSCFFINSYVIRRSTSPHKCLRSSPAARILAIAAWIAAKFTNVKDSVLYGQLLEEHGVVYPGKDKRRFVRRTVEKFKETHDIADEPGGGRPRKIPPHLVDECADILRLGYISKGQQCWYASVDEAVKFSAPMARAVGQAKCTPKEMEKAIQTAHPSLVRRTLEVRPPISPDLKADRERRAQEGIKLTKQQRGELVFIDEYTIRLTRRTSISVLVPKGTKLLTGEDSQLLKKGKKTEFILKGIYAVNADVGPVLWRPLSGTTEYATPYKVKHHLDVLHRLSLRHVPCHVTLASVLPRLC